MNRPVGPLSVDHLAFDVFAVSEAFASSSPSALTPSPAVTKIPFVPYLLFRAFCGGEIVTDMARSAIGILLLVGLHATVSGASADDVASPLEPNDAIACFQVDAGLEVELVACEPDVVDPIAIRFDEDGRLWVVEMRDYPHGPSDGQRPLSKIRVLTDQDGDGRYETSRTFADGLLFATGMQPWRGGVIVTLAGEVIYLKDTDGDDRADLRETWYQGFVAENPQLRANHPRFGLDHHVYIANGLRGGKIVDPRLEKSEAVEISGRDFRFDPRDGTCEAVSGNGQFGLTFDDFGNRFVCSNRQPLDHVVLENRYLARNPLAAIPAVLSPVAAPGEQSRVYPLTSAWTTSNLHAGQFTAACGIDIYRGTALGDAYHGNGFTCEPTGSLVHREVLAPQGATFTSKSATPRKEFLASPDSWFRPVNLEVGPDGALYVVDMYRAVIEHPQFMPSELQQRPDLRLGDDRGRIYRIVPKRFERPSRQVHLSAASTAEVAAQLADDNVWQRETAARLIYERQDKAAVAPLEKLARESDSPAIRIAALWALDGLESLRATLLAKTLDDEAPHVREQAVVLAEPLLNDNAKLRDRIVGLASDSDPRLRFQVALSLGGVTANEAIPPLAAIAVNGANDVWTRSAVATSRPESVAAILNVALHSNEVANARFDSSQSQAIRELAAIVGARRDPDEISSLIRQVCEINRASREVRAATLLGLADGCKRRGTALWSLVAALPDGVSLEKLLTTFFDEEVSTAESVAAPEIARLRALDLLAHSRQQAATKACLRLATESSSQQVRVHAAAALAEHPDESIAPALLASYPEQTPIVRSAIRDSLAVRPEAARQLLDAVRSGQIARAELGAACERRLIQHRNEGVRRLAAEVLKTEVPAERRAVLTDYQGVIDLPADPRAARICFDSIVLPVTILAMLAWTSRRTSPIRA